MSFKAAPICQVSFVSDTRSQPSMTTSLYCLVTFPPGEIFEEIASDLNLSVAWERLWAKDPSSIRSLVEGAGYSSIEISSFEYPSVIKVHDTKSPEEIDQLWDSWIKLPMVENLGKRLNEEQLREAKTMFESKWKKYGEMFGDENGKVEERIKVWIVKARK